MPKHQINYPKDGNTIPPLFLAFGTAEAGFSLRLLHPAQSKTEPWPVPPPRKLRDAPTWTVLYNVSESDGYTLELLDKDGQVQHQVSKLKVMKPKPKPKPKQEDGYDATVSYPGPGTYSASNFSTMGQYTDTGQVSVTMTNTDTNTTYGPDGAIYQQDGIWSAGFGNLPTGTYRLDVTQVGGTGQSVSNIVLQ